MYTAGLCGEIVWLSMQKVFSYRRGELWCEGVPLGRIAARLGTPTYVYSQQSIEAALEGLERAFAGVPHTLCYSVKANSNRALLRLVGRRGLGFDIVSGGELYRVLQAVGPKAAPRVVFSGVGKTTEEVDFALRSRILFFQVESADELNLIAARARHLRRPARIAVRINPDVAAGTHPHISTGEQEHKFGVAATEAMELARRAAGDAWLEFVGIGCHIGSQITRLAPFRRALARMRRVAEELNHAGLRVRYLDIGGGIGIRYQQEKVFGLAAYARTIQRATRGLGCHLILEPGRAVVGPAGVLLARVLVRKRGAEKDFLVLDVGMNDLLRPALYGARHRILPVREANPGPTMRVDVVGPICETSDTFARGVRLPWLAVGELVAICDVGAYGFVQASNYNSRRRPAEVLVSGRRFRVIRRCEQWADLMRGETRS